MKKKEFKAALIVALTTSGIESAQEAILESACGKLGRQLRKDTGEVLWAEEHVPTAITFYNEYGKPTVKEEEATNGEATAETAKAKSASKKKPAAVAKPMKKSATKKKAPAKKASRKKKK
jgi:hypothetical protein